MTKRNKVPPGEGVMNSVWQGARFWLPIGLSLTAVIFSGLQWIDTHQQKRFSARPLVDFVLENDPDDAAWIGLAIKNNGPAPAILAATKSLRAAECTPLSVAAVGVRRFAESVSWL